jgi:L,D-transpeptidase ErfK/SrfK
LNKGSYLIHGTNKPPVSASGDEWCIQALSGRHKEAIENTPVKTPVVFVNQPYRVGQRDGIVYMEVHRPFEESGTTELERTYKKIENYRKKVWTHA